MDWKSNSKIDRNHRIKVAVKQYLWVIAFIAFVIVASGKGNL